MGSVEISVRDLAVQYGTVTAVRDASFDVQGGEQLTLLGPSGCGKTTILRAIAGLEQPTKGEIRIGGEVMYSGQAGINVRPETRGLSMVFQSYAIWPHMTVFENVAYGLRVRGVRGAELDRRVQEALAMVQMQAFVRRGASQLSGGQQQRVALARAFVFSPSVLLFIASVRELGASILLMGPKAKVITPAIVESWFATSSELTAAMALLQTVVVAIAVAVLLVSTRRLAQFEGE